MNKPYTLTLSLCFGLSLVTQAQNPSTIDSLLTETTRRYAPDKRTALFSVKAISTPDSLSYILKGVTNQPQAYTFLTEALTRRKIQYKDSIRLLPDTALHGKTYGLVNLSVICMRSRPSYMSGLDTQTLLGAPVRLLEKDSWWHIQSADGYLGWTHYTSIVPLTPREMEDWIKAKKIIVTTLSTYGYSRPDTKSPIISDLIAGNRLKLLGKKKKFYEVEYPDGRIAYLPVKDGMEENQWLHTRHPDASHLIQTAYTMNGFPYLWGGTSAKGMDCSGFVKTCAFLNGLILARDASQMAYTGKQRSSTDFHTFQPGDLLFFGRPASNGKKASVSHVALYIGKGRFIHSLGYVHVGSLDPEDKEYYDAFNAGRFLWACDILSHIGSPGIEWIGNNKLYRLPLDRDLVH